MPRDGYNHVESPPRLPVWTTTAVGPDRPSGDLANAAPGRVRRITKRLAIGALVWLAITFLLRDPLHYLIDSSPASFGRFWPNRAWVLAHVVGGVVALVLGPFQFWTWLRSRRPIVHHWIGRSYLAGVALAGAPAFYLAWVAPNRSFGVALFALAAVWCLASGIAFAAILTRRISTHRAWMIRSYIITFAFVTFRFLGVLPIWGPFGRHGEAAAAWVSWVAPILVFQVILRRHDREARSIA